MMQSTNRFSSPPSKMQLSFYRKLYLAWLVDAEPHNVPSLMQATGMPRRTVQDALSGLTDLDIQCEFRQAEGQLNNTGHYAILNWGPIDKTWIENHLPQLEHALDLKGPFPS